MSSDDSGVDIEALAGAAMSVSGPEASPHGAKLSRKERRIQKKELKRQLKEAKKASKEQSRRYRSIKRQLKDRDKELSDRTKAARKRRKSAKSVVRYLGWERMFVDGICEVEEGLWSATMEFSDVSYHSARDEVQTGMFEAMSRLYNEFGPDTAIQESIVNTPLAKDDVGKRRFFDPGSQSTETAADDAGIYNEILNDKMRQGVSNIRRRRFLTASVAAEDADEAARKLSRIEGSVRRALGGIGSTVLPLDGTERLRAINDLLNPGKPFLFDFRDVGPLGHTTKDLLAPACIDFKPEGYMSDCFKVDGMWCQVLLMRRWGSELTDRALADLIDLPIPLAVTWHMQPMDKAKAAAFVRQRAAWIDKEIIEEQTTAVNKGYDFSILPAELKYAKDDNARVMDYIQNKNQHLFRFTGLVYTYAETKEQLDSQIIRIVSTARGNSVEVDVFDLRQREGFNSILPLGHNHCGVTRHFTTGQIAIMMPFATQELADEGGSYYGQNKYSNNLVFCNRKLLTSPMGFICGKPGSGKSMFVKNELANTVMLNPTDEVIVIDRAGEYTEIARHYGGSVFDFRAGGAASLNPFDMVSVEHMPRAAQIAFKADALLAQASASAAEAGKMLSEADQSIITRCVEQVFQNGGDALLGDFYDALRAQPEAQASDIALRYERFVNGPMGFFNRPTSVDFNARVVDFDLKELPDSMLVFALITVCEAVRNRMYHNHARGVRTWLYVEEIQSMFQYPTVLNYFSRFAAEGRKFGLLLTGITQNATAMLRSEAAQAIVLNADFLMLLKQSPLDRREWASLLNLSAQEEECIDEGTEAGDGLLIAGNAHVPLKGRFPEKMPDGRVNPLYKMFSTNPNERR